MNTTAMGTTIRVIALALTLVAAAALGLAVGNVMQGEAASGAGAPRAADAALSLEAIAALQAIRDDPTAAAADDFADYGLRHGAEASSDDYLDYGLRHEGTTANATTESATTPTPR